MLTKAVLALFTVAYGAAVGLSDLRVQEVQPVAMLVTSFGFILGAAYPDGAWRRAVMLGLSVPLAHVVSSLTGATLPYPLPPFADTFLALVPAFAGTFLGVGVRRLLGPPAKQHPRG